MNIMKKITLGTLLTGALLLPQSTHASLALETANVTMNVALFSAITNLNDIILAASGTDGAQGTTYTGVATFDVESNGQVTIAIAGSDMVLGVDTLTTLYDLDATAGISVDTAAGVAHYAQHSVEISADLGLISAQAAGEYAGSFSVTISATI
jgi:hypothetical protein